MPQLGELRYVFSMDTMENNWVRLLRNTMSRYDERGKAENAMIKTTRKHISRNGVQEFC